MVYIEYSFSSSSVGDTEGTSESEDPAMLIRSPPEKIVEERHLAQVRITSLGSELHLYRMT